MPMFGTNVLLVLGLCSTLFLAYAYLTRWRQRRLLDLPVSCSHRWGKLWPLISSARALKKRGGVAENDTTVLRIYALLTLLPSLLGVLMLFADAAQPAWPWVWHAVLPGFAHDLIWHLIWFNASLLGLALWGSAMPWRPKNSPVMPMISQILFANLVICLGSGGAIWLTRTWDMREISLNSTQVLPIFLLQPLGLLVTWIALWLASRRTLTSTATTDANWPDPFQWQQAGMPFAWLHLAEFLQEVYAAGLLTMIFFGGGKGWSGHVHPLWFLLKTALLLPALIWLDQRWISAHTSPQSLTLLRLTAVALVNLALTASILAWRSFT